MRKSLRSVAATLAVAGMMTTGMTPLLAAQKSASAAATASGATALLEARVAEARVRLAAMERAGQIKPEQAKRMRLRIDIAAAKSPAERHNLIQQLPVKVDRSVAANGDVTRRYSVDGTVRFTIVTPVQDQSRGIAPADDETARRDDCYSDGEQDDCATEQEVDDLAIAVADAGAELSYYESEASTALAAYDNYCSQNPWACQLPPAEALVQPDGATALAGGAYKPCWETIASGAAALNLGWNIRNEADFRLFLHEMFIVRLGARAVIMALIEMLGGTVLAGIGVGLIGWCVWSMMEPTEPPQAVASLVRYNQELAILRQ